MLVQFSIVTVIGLVLSLLFFVTLLNNLACCMVLFPRQVNPQTTKKVECRPDSGQILGFTLGPYLQHDTVQAFELHEFAWSVNPNRQNLSTKNVR